jgi:hypothetical protein
MNDQMPMTLGIIASHEGTTLQAIEMLRREDHL